jgi:ubiquinone/menaquinone biosynthesis C-methylase UbiE
MAMQKSPTIADYDSSNYNYENYWKGREYEDEADRIALESLLKYEKPHIKPDDFYIDIGGSYGREVENYAKYFNHIILLDYSINSLKKAKQYLDAKSITKVSYIAANLYFLPFKNESIASGQMVRVLHHIKVPKRAFDELNRVFYKFFILEFANKNHAKFVAKSLMKGNMGVITNKEPMQQTSRETSQGSSGTDQIFLNFHPSDITLKLAATNFHIMKKLSVSNLRFPQLKKLLGTKTLVGMEKALQSPLASLHFGPSMYYLLEKKTIAETKKDAEITDLLACPKCNGRLNFSKNQMSCDQCSLSFVQDDGVFDLRYEGNLS